jgi:hypothetical protein
MLITPLLKLFPASFNFSCHLKHWGAILPRLPCLPNCIFTPLMRRPHLFKSETVSARTQASSNRLKINSHGSVVRKNSMKMINSAIWKLEEPIRTCQATVQTFKNPSSSILLIPPRVRRPHKTQIYKTTIINHLPKGFHLRFGSCHPTPFFLTL